MFFKTHSILKEIAREFKDVCFIVKTHPQQRDYSLILREFSDKSPNTVLLSGAQISNQLIVNSDVVVGFQSTALIETMLLNIPILYPFWGKSAEKFSNQLIPFHFSNAVDTCQSPEILGHNLKAYIENPRPIEKVQRVARQKFLEEYMYKVDGHASGRALSEIDKSLHIPEKNNFHHLISIAE